MTLTCFASAETVKHERVYAVTNAAGDALTVIDNVRLENGDALAEIDDRTLLTALENVGGTEKFTQSGETVTWNADGNSIIYQGTSDKALNVTPRRPHDAGRQRNHRRGREECIRRAGDDRLLPRRIPPSSP